MKILLYLLLAPLIVLDTEAPVITLVGTSQVSVNQGATYTDAGTTATDNFDGNIAANITAISTVDTSVAGTYTIAYNVSDAAGNAATPVVRTVYVLDIERPVITLLGSNPLEINKGTTYTDAGATATDDVDGDITDDITVTSTVDTSTVGTYTVTYNVSDAAGNAATPVVRTITVNPVEINPTETGILLNGTVSAENNQIKNVADPSAEQDAINKRYLDQRLTTNEELVNIQYLDQIIDQLQSLIDGLQEEINILKTDTQAPVITLLGDNSINVNQGATYTDSGATATDNVDGNITGNIVITNTVNTTIAGTYTVTYNVTDAAGNAATPVVRAVNVLDIDSDGDGYTVGQGDCDDSDAAIYPGAPEICDGIDNDCDGEVDEGVTTPYYEDADGDGYGLSTVGPVMTCSPPAGYVSNNLDCDDSDAAIYPGATEIEDGIDNDCDGDIDEGFDSDDDGYTVGQGDCDDSDPDIYPGAPEICDGIDNDCDGEVDEGVTTPYYEDADGDGYGLSTVGPVMTCSPPAGYVSNNLDCDDSDAAIYPGATEIEDGIDNDCDGDIDE